MKIFLRHNNGLQRAGRNGFTLIELLLGLTIFAIVSLCIYGTFWGGIKVDNSAEQQNKIYREVRWSFDVMSKELENMLLYNFSNSYPEKSSFSGSENRVQFVVGSSDGLKVVSYYLVDPEDDQVFKVVMGDVFSKNIRVDTGSRSDIRINYLVREEIDFIDFLNEASGDVETEIIAMSVKEDGLKFSYGFVQGEESSDFAWEDEWQNKYTPSHVKITIDFVSSGKNQIVKSLSKELLIPSGFLGTSGG